jgi:predicted nucleotidyltransferase/uncharacterized protein (UPF0332 family)
MEFKIENQKNPNLENYNKEDFDKAFEFAKEITKEFGTLVKAVVLFGSAARKKVVTGDIDVLIVVDDVTVTLSAEMVEAYRIIVEKLLAKISKRIHVTTLKFTSFWEYIRVGDPIGINILRDGIPLIDAGFFEPVQALLFQGRIRPTQESVWTYYSRSPAALQNSKWHLLQATVDLYWAVIDASHAALMSVGEIPPSPSHVADLLDEKLVKTGKLEKRYIEIMRNLYALSKSILHREIQEVSGKEFDKYFDDAKTYCDRMKIFIEK